MRIVKLTALLVNLPLKREIKHASATRRESVNLLIRSTRADGAEGWGEGVPRPYVTGETPEGTVAQLAATPLSQLGQECGNWEDVLAMCDRFQPSLDREDPRGCYGNALRCAVELSVLDAFGQLFGEPVSNVTQRVPEARDILTVNHEVRYSGAITADSARAERIGAVKMRLYGFAHCKVKVGVAGADDASRLRNIRRWAGPRIDLRLDANEAWSADQLPEKIAPLLPYRISCLEQPVPHAEVQRLSEMRGKLGVPIMLDESLTSQSDARAAIAAGTCDLFNIRLSKCGGFLSSLRLAALAREAGLGYQLGCHPGETGILSAAGRHFATSVAGIRYLEGSYDRHLLKELLTNEDITFRYGGRAPALAGPGLGVTVNPAALARLGSQEQDFPVE